MSSDALSSIDLRSLFETSRLFNSTSDPAFIADHLLRTIMGKLMVTRGAVYGKAGDLSTDLYHRTASKGLFKSPLPDAATANELAQLCENSDYLFFPMQTESVITGFLFFSKPMGKTGLNDDQDEFVRSLLEFSAGALESSLRFQEIKQARQQLALKVHDLKTLYELSQAVTGLTEPEAVFNLISLTILGQSRFTAVGIYEKLLDSAGWKQIYRRGGKLNPEIGVFNLPDSDIPIILIPGSADWTKFCDIGEQRLVIFPVRIPFSALIVLRQKDTDSSILEFYQSMISLLELACTNIANYHESLKKNQLEKDLAIARDIQNGLLPSTFDHLKPFDFYGINIPSLFVGGDYYDCFRLPDNRIVFAIADVTGKGTPASLLMANLQSIIKVIVQFPLALSDMTGRINEIIYRNTAPDKFITFFWGIIDPAKEEITYVNAGHNPPYLFQDGQVKELGVGGVILGVMPTLIPYEQATISFHPGDRLFVFTDGVTEAMNPEKEEFGEAQVLRALAEWKGQSSKGFTDYILSAIRDFASGEHQSDDITIITVQWPIS